MGTQYHALGETAVAEPDAKIVFRDISLIFHLRKGSNGASDFVALKDISLEVKKGEFVALVGPSGCGKSSLLDILAGLTKATTGTAFIDGKPITGPALDRGIVFQGYALFPWRSVQQNVEFGLEVKKVPKAQRKETSSHFINLVGLKGFEDRFPHELSGGMKQRAAIARALAYDPEVLLMDEPFAAVDAQTRETLQDELLRIWDATQKTIVFVTHSIEEAVFLADRVAVLTPNPGTVRGIIPIDLLRPRQNSGIRSSPEFAWIRHRISELLQNKSHVDHKTEGISVATAISPSAVI